MTKAHSQGGHSRLKGEGCRRGPPLATGCGQAYLQVNKTSEIISDLQVNSTSEIHGLEAKNQGTVEPDETPVRSTLGNRFRALEVCSLT